MTADSRTDALARLDHAHVWHPFTAMAAWRQEPPLIIERGEGDYLVDTEGNRYLDGVSSLWCNVHGHQVDAIDDAVRDQLGRIAHSTLLGLANPPSIEYAAKLAAVCPGDLNTVFYSDAGATAVEVGFKMAVGYWYHRGRPEKCKFIGLAGAYHGDTTGSMSVGYSDLFHKPFVSMVFDVTSFPSPDPCRLPSELAERFPAEDDGPWPSENPELAEALKRHSLDALDRMLAKQADETAAIVIEPVMQGAAGMIAQPDGFVKGVAKLAKKHDVLLIADEVAVGFGRTGRLFAVEHDNVVPDILCLAKGISGGYLPLAATVVSDAIDRVWAGDEPLDRRTLYHGHTYTGNPLACAAAIASLDLFEQNDLIAHIQQSASIMREKLEPLRGHRNILDVRQRGLMVGIELCRDKRSAEPFDFSKRTAHAVCNAMRPKGLIIRPLGDVMILMPIPAMSHDHLTEMMDIVVETLSGWSFE